MKKAQTLWLACFTSALLAVISLVTLATAGAPAVAAPLAATADGINMKSPLADISQKYKDLKHTKYTVKDARIDYYDDVKRGICFEFSAVAEEGPAGEHMYAILVHAPGKPVIPDADERPAGKL